jgi:hypothetical protein
MDDKQYEGSRFLVDLGSLKLPEMLERQVESEIRAVVLKALAAPEVTSMRRLDPSIFDKFPGRTKGLWIDPENPDLGSWEDTVPR